MTTLVMKSSGTIFFPSQIPGFKRTVVSLNSSANEVLPKYVILSNESLPVNNHWYGRTSMTAAIETGSCYLKGNFEPMPFLLRKINAERVSRLDSLNSE